MRFCTVLAVAPLFLTVARPAPLAAQTILGRVLDQVNEAPIGGAILTLVTRTGEERVRTLADSVGRFVIEPPEAGESFLQDIS